MYQEASSINESFAPKAKVKYFAEQSSHTGQNVVVVVVVVVVQSEWPSSKHFKIISAGTDVEKREPSHIAG